MSTPGGERPAALPSPRCPCTAGRLSAGARRSDGLDPDRARPEAPMSVHLVFDLLAKAASRGCHLEPSPPPARDLARDHGLRGGPAARLRPKLGPSRDTAAQCPGPVDRCNAALTACVWWRTDSSVQAAGVLSSPGLARTTVPCQPRPACDQDPARKTAISRAEHHARQAFSVRPDPAPTGADVRRGKTTGSVSQARSVRRRPRPLR